MKLAEALARRSDLQARLQHLEQRLYAVARVQMGDNPPETPETLLVEIDRCFDELNTLICAIDRTNSQAELEGKPLIDLLTERSLLRKRQRVLQNLIDHAAMPITRLTKSEIRYVSTVKVTILQQQADELGKRYRNLDLCIQAANWEIDLLQAEEEQVKEDQVKEEQNTES